MELSSESGITSVKPFLRLASDDAKEGVVYVRVIRNSVPKSKSLRIKVKSKDWHDHMWVIRGSNKEEANRRIKEAIESFSRPHEIVLTGRSQFIHYLRTQLDTLNQITGRPRYKVTTASLYKAAIDCFEDFAQGRKLRFDDVNAMLIESWYYWMRSEAEQPGRNRRLTIRGAKSYIKCLAAVARTAEAKGLYRFYPDPFLKKGADESGSELLKERRVVSRAELMAFAKAPNLTVKQKEAQLLFLAQVFGQGARISDAMLWRWSMITDQNVLPYRSRKTDTRLKLQVKFYFKNVLLEMAALTDPDVMKPYLDAKHSYETYNVGLDEKPIHIDGSRWMKPEEFLASMKAHYDEQADRCLIAIGKKYPSKFIFNLLSDEVIPLGTDTTRVSKQQNDHMVARRNAYNHHLRAIAKKAKIEHVYAHASRHTFASILRDMGASVEEIMKLMGHSSYDMTLKYLGELDASIVERNNERLAAALPQLEDAISRHNPIVFPESTSTMWDDLFGIKPFNPADHVFSSPEESKQVADDDYL